jgi:hypothetical protein
MLNQTMGGILHLLGRLALTIPKVRRGQILSWQWSSFEQPGGLPSSSEIMNAMCYFTETI